MLYLAAKMSPLVCRSLFFVIFVVTALVSFASSRDTDTTQFEAAFQGRCGRDSPCEQLCHELHDGMFECDCEQGFTLRTNGYGCSSIEDGVIASSSVDDGVDVIYRKDASFSASLERREEARGEHDVADDAAATAATAVASSRGPRPLPRDSAPTETASPLAAIDCRAARVCADATAPPTTDDGASSRRRNRCRPAATESEQSDCAATADTRIRVPKFGGRSWLAFPVLKAAYKHVHLQMEFRPASWHGILFLTGERDDLAGDFVAAVLREGFVEFRFDCGSGVGVVRSDETVSLDKWNKLVVYRHRWDAWIRLNNGKHVRGRSKGLFSRITFREPVFIGGRGNTTVLTDKIPTEAGFQGCVRYLEINGVPYNFATSPAGDAVTAFDVEECVADKCGDEPCEHGGKCVSNEDSTRCLCPLGFAGDLCETRLDLQVPLFNGSSYLKYRGLGYGSLSWLDVEMVLKPISPDGIVLYNGDKIDGMGDFIAIYMSAGYLTFAFDLGTGSATLRSAYPVSLNEWHTLRISRTGRYAWLRVDAQPAVQASSPGAFTQLSLPSNLWVGGVPDQHAISPKIKIDRSFVGCIQKISVNERSLPILAEALAGLNVDNCPHPCLAKPCGFEADVSCRPLFDSYKCVCQRNCRSIRIDPNPELVSSTHNQITPAADIVAFDAQTFLHYTDPRVNERMSGDKMELNFRFRTVSVMGLLLWYGSARRNDKGFLCLGIVNGYLHLSFKAGDGDQVSLLYDRTRVDDGHWHRVNIFRRKLTGSMMVDDKEAIAIQTDQSLERVDTNSGLYIGGVENVATTTDRRYTKGIKGCISDFILNSDYHLRLSWKKEDITVCE